MVYLICHFQLYFGLKCLDFLEFIFLYFFYFMFFFYSVSDSQKEFSVVLS